jgi:hypothetical protein
LPGFQQFASDAFNPFRVLSFAKNHLGKATTPASIKVDMGVTQVGHTVAL